MSPKILNVICGSKHSLQCMFVSIIGFVLVYRIVVGFWRNEFAILTDISMSGKIMNIKGTI